MIGLKGIISLAGFTILDAFVLTNRSIRISGSFHKSSSFQDDFIDQQKTISDGSPRATQEDSNAFSSIQSHLNHQQNCFDEMSEFFNSEEATPPDVERILHFMVNKVLVESMEGKQDCKKLSILDVGCGTGALFPFYIDVADDLGVELEITGMDLSPKMTAYATENGKKIMKDSGKHSIVCETGDFVMKIMGVEVCGDSLIGFENGVVDERTNEFRGKFDVVMINACFGNFFDSNSVITAAATALKNEGIFVISHPLGAEFVEKLGEENPEMVPNPLPSKIALSTLLKFQPMEVMNVIGNTEIENEKKDIYYASMKKKSSRLLREIVRLRGSVDQGYGRGGKKLGFPTANLPSSLFADALANVPTGVYVGSASIEKSSKGGKGRDVVHKAVVNVGFSPTFDGEENREKIVEAHLIVNEGDIEGDFYSETMRLALFGYIRGEMKFPSFPDLIKAITNDVETAKASLDLPPYSTFSNERFLLADGDIWVGETGGDSTASYEFESTVDFLSKMR